MTVAEGVRTVRQHGEKDAAGAHTADAPRETRRPHRDAQPLWRDLLAAGLAQLGCAVVPPREPEAVASYLRAAGLVVWERALYVAGDLEEWEPHLLVVPCRRCGDAGRSPDPAGRPA